MPFDKPTRNALARMVGAARERLKAVTEVTIAALCSAVGAGAVACATLEGPAVVITSWEYGLVALLARAPGVGPRSMPSCSVPHPAMNTTDRRLLNEVPLSKAAKGLCSRAEPWPLLRISTEVWKDAKNGKKANEGAWICVPLYNPRQPNMKTHNCNRA
jgi:hypothetical protein